MNKYEKMQLEKSKQLYSKEAALSASEVFRKAIAQKRHELIKEKREVCLALINLRKRLKDIETILSVEIHI